MAGIDWNTKALGEGFDKLIAQMQGAEEKALTDIGYELLRLSGKEVPHDKGLLQNSGRVERIDKEQVDVGYNKVYAARLHEHPEYHFQNGRKGKFLEDPLKTNLSIFERYWVDETGAVLR
jgi:hypothetical protein